MFDVVIAGGGPAGLTAALILGRARKRVLLADGGTPRNAAAARVQGFVTRDGTPPPEFRRIGREQLVPYPSVEIADARVLGIAGAEGHFEVELADRVVTARRILLCVGMIDELPEIPGFREMWGKSIFQCPYCHAWEVRERAFGVIPPSAEWLEWALLIRGWSPDVMVFTNGAFAVPAEIRSRLAAASVPIEERAIRALVAAPDGSLEGLELAGGTRVPRDFVFVRPPQRQTDLVRRLGLALDPAGFVVVNEEMKTAVPGISAAGDLTGKLQTAQIAAASGARAAYALNHALAMENAAGGG